jgi:hypothetical protein
MDNSRQHSVQQLRATIGVDYTCLLVALPLKYHVHPAPDAALERQTRTYAHPSLTTPAVFIILTICLDLLH